MSVEACCLAIGNAVGHESVLSASRMNSAVVVFLDSIDKANELVEQGIVVDNELVPVLPLALPAKRVTLSNVPPFMSDDILSQALSRYGKLVSRIKKISISSDSPLLKHVVSFRRFVYMIVNDDTELDLSLNFRVDDYDYIVFVTTAKIKCFGCSQLGHLVRNCPDKNVENETPIADGISASVEAAVATGVAEAVLPESGSVVAATAAGSPAEDVARPSAARHEYSHSESTGAILEDDMVVSESLELPQGNIIKDTVSDMICETDCASLDVQETVFKAPLKRKKSDRVSEAKISKKSVEEDVEETGSDGESSDSSASLSQSDFIGRSYELDDIKLFLRATKNKRGVRVQEYFPDLKQFVDKTKNFMAESCFTNKEVYRLKKIVRNVNIALGNDDG